MPRLRGSFICAKCRVVGRSHTFLQYSKGSGILVQLVQLFGVTSAPFKKRSCSSRVPTPDSMVPERRLLLTRMHILGPGKPEHLGIPLTTEGAVETLLHGVPVCLDLGCASGHIFVTVAACGFTSIRSDSLASIDVRPLTQTRSPVSTPPRQSATSSEFVYVCLVMYI